MTRNPSPFDFRDPKVLGSSEVRRHIEKNLQSTRAQQLRKMFAEINPHLVGKPQFENRWTTKRRAAAVLIPVIARPEPTVLLTVRSSQMPSHPGQIAFPGGKVQAEDPTPIDTALREAEEEVGIPRQQVDVVGTLGIHEGGLGFSVTPVVGIVPPEMEIKPCEREVAEVFETPLHFFLDRKSYIFEEYEEQGEKYRMLAAPYEQYHIWGLTACILQSLAMALLPEEDFAP